MAQHITKKRTDKPLLIVGETGDTYFVGDLEAGKRLVHEDRFISEQYSDERDRWLVELCDDPDCLYVAEWGAGPAAEVAWRYALGAAMGPIDSEYDEEGLRASLAGWAA